MVDRGMEDKIRRRGGGILLCMVKGQRVSESTLAFSASHEACRRMAAFRLQLARSSIRPANGGKTSASLHGPLHPCAPLARSPGSRGSTPCASRGTCCATAVKPRPSFMSPYAPARQRRAVRKRTQSATTVMSEPNHFSEMATREPSAFISFRMSCTLSRRARSSLRKPMP